MVQMRLKILKNMLWVKKKHSPNLLLYMSFDADFYADSEYIWIYLLIANLRWISGQKVNIEINILA